MTKYRIYHCTCLSYEWADECLTPWIVETPNYRDDDNFATYEEARQYVAGLIDKETS